MALTEKYANFDLATGFNDGTSEANAWQSWADITFAAGERVNIKRCSSRQSLGSVSMSVSGTAGSPVWLRGYGSTIGDGTKFHWTGDLSQSGDGVILECLDGENSSGTARMYNCTGSTRLVQCRGVHTLTGSAVFAPMALRASGCVAIGCEASIAGNRAGSDGAAIKSDVYAVIYGCSAKGSGNAQAVYVTANFDATQLLRCTVDGNGDVGVLVNSGAPRGVLLLSGNSIYNCTDGVQLGTVFTIGGDGCLMVINNIFYLCAGYGINNSSGTNLLEGLVINNAMGSITSTRLNGFGDVEEIGDITLSGNPWTDAANGDFTLNNTAGAGAACREVGYPTDIDQDGTQDNWRDLGALQHECPAGGGGGGGTGLIGIGGGMIGVVN
jgi:hypothetical protein